MARPREFDEELVLKQSMAVFWTKGYKATSLDDLTKATKLNKQSIYCAFGDKRSLFIKILELYRSQRLATLNKILAQADSPLEGIQNVLRTSLVREPNDERPPGCLFVSTALEFGDLDPDIADEIKTMFSSFEQLFATAIEQGQKIGNISSRFPSKIIAKTILNTLVGLRVSEKRGEPQEEIEAVIHFAIASIRN